MKTATSFLCTFAIVVAGALIGSSVSNAGLCDWRLTTCAIPCNVDETFLNYGVDEDLAPQTDGGYQYDPQSNQHKASIIKYNPANQQPCNWFWATDCQAVEMCDPNQ